MSNATDLRRLEEIQQELMELAHEAKSIGSRLSREVGQPIIWERAKAYWYAQLVISLSNDHEYIGGATCSMTDTIESLQEIIGEEDASEDDDEEDSENDSMDGDAESALASAGFGTDEDYGPSYDNEPDDIG